jgi:hypothetical protein
MIQGDARHPSSAWNPRRQPVQVAAPARSGESLSSTKLYGMRASFDETAGKGLARRDEIYPLIASLGGSAKLAKLIIYRKYQHIVGAPRSTKMGNTRSPWRYDATAEGSQWRAFPRRPARSALRHALLQ